jgi:hypothetical protein
MGYQRMSMAMFSKVADLFQTVLKFLRFLNVFFDMSDMFLRVSSWFLKFSAGFEISRTCLGQFSEFFDVS